MRKLLRAPPPPPPACISSRREWHLRDGLLTELDAERHDLPGLRGRETERAVLPELPQLGLALEREQRGHLVESRERLAH